MLLDLSKILMLLLLLLSPSIYGQEKNCKDTFTLGLGSVWPPYYYEEEGEVKGIDIQIIENIFSQTNICLRFLKMPSSSRSLAELKKGAIDFIYGASFTHEREKYAIYSEPYRHETVRLFWKKAELSEYHNASLADLFTAKLRVATNRGAHIGGYGVALTKKENEPYISNVPTIERRMKMLTFDRVDFTLEDEVAGRYYLKTHPESLIEMHPFVVYQNEVSLLFSRKTISTRQVEKINSIIHRNKQRYKEMLIGY
jgi:polar amino acid transport system substrate-binding protein